MLKCISLIAFVLAAAPVFADEQILSFGLENDALTRSGDANYTNGVRLSWLDAELKPPAFARYVAENIPFFNAGNPMVVQYSLGQNLYTPSDINSFNADPSDRPYAGYAYGSIGMTEGNGQVVNEMELSLGWVGPSALGEETQKLVHDIGGFQKPNGWKRQLHDEPVVNVAMQRRWPTFWQTPLGETSLSLMPHAGGSLGNGYTHGSVGATLRWSSQRDFAVDNPVRVRPALPGTGYFDYDNHVNWLLFAGAEGRVVGRNIFLDGNTFQNSPSVDKKWLVGDLSAGVVLTYKDYQVGYSAVYRSHEFYGQDNGQIFGALTFGVRF